MVTWGIMAALTAVVKVPWHFYTVRFLLGLAEAGFYPGVIVYLTHWFPSRDRARALAYFFIATPIAQFVSPKLSNLLLRIGTDETINGGSWSTTPRSGAWRAGSGSTSPGASRRSSWGSWSCSS